MLLVGTWFILIGFILSIPFLFFIQTKEGLSKHIFQFIKALIFLGVIIAAASITVYFAVIILGVILIFIVETYVDKRRERS